MSPDTPPASRPDAWFVQRGPERYGPFPFDELARLASEGRIEGGDIVWRDGDQQSWPASSISGLMPRQRNRWLPITIAGVAAVAVLAASLLVIRSSPDEHAEPSVTTLHPGERGDPDGVGVISITGPDESALLVVDGRVIVGDQILVMVPGPGAEAIAEAAAGAVGGEVVGRVELAEMFQIRIPATDARGIERAVAAAEAVEGVALAAPNAALTRDEEVWGVRETPLNDPVYQDGRDGALRLVGAQQAWDYLAGSGLARHPVHVGVLDDGLYRGADPELSEFPSIEGRGVQVRYPDPDAGELTAPRTLSDGSLDPGGSHGTGVMTTLAGDPDRGGAVGVAGPLRQDLTISTTNVFTPPYGSSGFSVVDPDPGDDAQVVWDDGVAYTTGIFAAVAAQIRDGARVINMSFGCTGCNAATARAYRMFFTRMAERHPGVLFVASAGNNRSASNPQPVDGTRRWPSGLDLSNMITVANVDNEGSPISSSNRVSDNFEVTIAAPGDRAVRGVGPDGEVIDTRGGTSNAAPQVAATAALLLSVNPNLTAAELKAIITQSARTSVRVDDDDIAIDASVGGRVLAVDEAVRRVIADQLGVPVGEVTQEMLENRAVIDAVAIGGEDDSWTVTGFVRGCLEGCTDVTISVSGDHAIGGSPTRSLSSPGEVSWSVTVMRYPAWIVVRRADTGAASRITLDPILLDGTWSGEALIESFAMTDEDGNVVPLGSAEIAQLREEGCDVEDVVGASLGLVLEIATAPGGSGTVVLSLTPPPELEGTPTTVTSELAWSGSSVSFQVEGGFWSGTAARQPDGSTILTGSFWTTAAVFVLSGSWSATRS